MYRPLPCLVNVRVGLAERSVWAASYVSLRIIGDVFRGNTGIVVRFPDNVCDRRIPDGLVGWTFSLTMRHYN